MVTTEGELFDLLRQRFGIGEWDEETHGERIPYWRFRNTEISKLKGMIRKRRTSVADLALAADYAVETKTKISNPFALLALIQPAKKAARDARVTPRAEIHQRLVEAAGQAQAAGDEAWATRLFSADPAAGEAVLAEWEASRR